MLFAYQISSFQRKRLPLQHVKTNVKKSREMGWKRKRCQQNKMQTLQNKPATAMTGLDMLKIYYSCSSRDEEG